MERVMNTPRNLTEDEWAYVLSAVDRHPVIRAVLEIMQENDNVPQQACDLFEGNQVNQRGQAYINDTFRKYKLPFRLTRIGNWVQEMSRNQRKLAVVPWPVKETENVAP
jgi:hypothetical protein